MENVIRLGNLLRLAATNEAGQANCQLFADAAARVDNIAAEALETLREAIRAMPPEQATEMTILLARADAR